MAAVQQQRAPAEHDEGKSTRKLSHRPRNLGARPLAQLSDAAIAGSLLSLLLPSWLLPEPMWSPLCRAVARVPGLVDRAILDRTIAGISGALPEAGPERAAAIALDLQAAVYELRMQNLRGWRPGGWRPAIDLEGEAHLTRALAAGKGAILWVAHFAFNGGITKIALHDRGHRVAHLSRPEHGFSKTRFGIACLNPVRCGPEDRYLAQRIVYDRRAPATAMRKMVQALNANRVVSITGGAWEGSSLVEASILGGTISMATGAPRLAALTGAALLPVFSVRGRDRRFRVAIEAPIELPRDTGSAGQSRSAVETYLARHESWIRQFPEQWRGWKEWRAPAGAVAGGTLRMVGKRTTL